MKKGIIHWLVKPIGCQSITKRCPTCEIKKLFYPSGCFRVNAQKKTLDVWNIYKCEKCNYTWNIDIFPRINTNKLNPELLEHFTQNNIEQVRRYSYDYPILKKNNAELGPIPEFIIDGSDPYALSDTDIVEIQILFEYSIPVRLINILTRKLSLSRGEVTKLVDHRVILDIAPQDLNKKLKKTLTFRFDLQHFYQIDPPLCTSIREPLENQ
ncbi:MULTISPECIES: DUF1062 domain-containing protein [Pseudomonas fluorescens group]|uniref:DUF1062 domain-containing protein n=1 Tax=Pseudomonas fluorescens group TaxID=136843 RepID=UPI000F55CBB3|nr:MULTISPECIES: DUF1062 domain-containing protein [Pseudomonas fluorescens group]AZE87724.1 hypothetical protein C4J97_1007 [Pseudomonas orientalis]MBD8147147.1 DUF1062 domain-containing protein [Pseudomonas fluorescens]MBD8175619.1 DUF1062 domain-containing protein [Pseudomonas fluorescens]MBD8744074.1 DUF1062 domain-containing protein [Pseudomonas fluorescens]MBD8750350.1 DUF1062 domain-containing protein [Pseudomonas fluorescens]